MMKLIRSIIAIVLVSSVSVLTFGCTPTTGKDPSKDTSTESTGLVSKPNDSTSSEEESVVQFPLEQTLSAKQAAERITNANVRDGGKVPSERVVIADFNPDWAFAHVAYLEIFNNKLYAMWASGRVNEDDLGQRVMYSVSEDFYTWSEPKPLVDSYRGVYSETVQGPSGFYVSGGKLHAYFYRNEYRPDLLRENGTLRPQADATSGSWLSSKMFVISTEDGVNWTDPVPCGVFATTQAVFKGSNNRDFMFIGASCRYNDTGDPFDWVISGADARPLAALGVGDIAEACGYMTDDRVLHMLVRNDSGYFYHSESYDNGETWGELARTNFAVERSMSNAGRLPDGSYYIICNSPNAKSWDRIPLYLYISKDGYNFDTRYIIRNEKDYRQKKVGMYKGGYFAYPTTIIYGDYMYIIYTKQKEVVEITRIDLNQIIDF